MEGNDPEITRKSGDLEMRKLKLTGLSAKQKKLLQDASFGIGGVALGALAMSLMGAGEAAESGGNGHAGGGAEAIEIEIFPEAPFCDGVSDDMSFSEAFSFARKEVGPGGFFEWNGNTYNTYYKEEWDAMTEEDKADFAASIDKAQEGQSYEMDEEIISILNGETDPDILIDHEDLVIEPEPMNVDDSPYVTNDDYPEDGNIPEDPGEVDDIDYMDDAESYI